MDKCIPVSLFSQDVNVDKKELIPAARTIDVTKSSFSCTGVLWFLAVFFVPGALIGKVLNVHCLIGVTFYCHD